MEAALRRVPQDALSGGRAADDWLPVLVLALSVVLVAVSQLRRALEGPSYKGSRLRANQALRRLLRRRGTIVESDSPASGAPDAELQAWAHEPPRAPAATVRAAPRPRKARRRGRGGGQGGAAAGAAAVGVAAATGAGLAPAADEAQGAAPHAPLDPPAQPAPLEPREPPAGAERLPWDPVAEAAAAAEAESETESEQAFAIMVRRWVRSTAHRHGAARGRSSSCSTTASGHLPAPEPFSAEASEDERAWDAPACEACRESGWGCDLHRTYTSSLLLAHRGLRARALAAPPPGLPRPPASAAPAAEAPLVQTVWDPARLSGPVFR